MSNPSEPPESANVDLEAELRHRLSLLSPQDTIRGMILNGVLESVRKLGGEAVAQQCLSAVGEKKFVDFFKYPSRIHLEFIYKAAALLDARYAGFEKALWHMGYQGGMSFLASAPGRILLLGQGSIRRVLGVVPAAFSVVGSTLESEVRWTGAKSAIFILKRDFIPPAYTVGTLQCLETVNVKGLRVRALPSEPLVGKYELAWD